MVLFLLPSLPLAAATFYATPGPANSAVNLRQAINDANANPGPDIVQVATGTYIIENAVSDDDGTGGDLDINDDLTIQGAAAGTTIIDGAGLGRVFDVNGSRAVSILDVTIQNGRASNGGCIYGGSGALALTRAVVRDGEATYYGGGIYLSGGSLEAIDSEFLDCTALGGGGIYILNSSAELHRSTVAGNAVSPGTAALGGGIYWDGTGGNKLLQVVDSIIRDNTATDDGGGIENFGGSIEITHCMIHDNSSGDDGGGIENDNHGSAGFLTISNSVFFNNSAINGGAIDNDGETTLVNTALFGNTATGTAEESWGSGGIRNSEDTESGTSMVITSCTLYGNRSHRGAGSLEAGDVGNIAIHGAEIRIQNSIVGHCYTDDTLASGTPGTMLSLGNNMFEDDTGCNKTMETNAPPDLVGDPQLISTNDYHLQPTSPCIEAGTNLPWMVGETDLDGQPRITGISVDIGADEHMDYSDFTYEINNPDTNTITITGYTGAGGAVVIPSDIDNKSVTRIGEGAFRDDVTLTSVTIPDSVISIGYWAFDQCGELTSITIGSSVTTIRNGAFYGCTGLTSVTIPDSVTNLGDGAFYFCHGLTSATIGNSVTAIGSMMFAYCSRLNGVYFKGNAPSADATAFQGAQQATVYYLYGTSGWGATFAGRPTQVWNPLIHSGDSPIHYVATNSSATWPYTNWLTAASTIQDAIDAAASNDTVLVDDGTYATGGAVVYSMSNRVALTKAINVESVHGPDFTLIVGAGPLGDTAVRCAYLTNGAALIGFTLTNGHTRTTGDYQNERSGGGAFCDNGGTASNCTITGNSADRNTGGIYCYHGGTINNCTISFNSAEYGGGVSIGKGTLNNCTISSNSAGDFGGGINCYDGGIINNCIISDNTASNYGGGVLCHQGTLNNCTISKNTAGNDGGGVLSLVSTLKNCTISSNTAGRRGGGIECSEGAGFLDGNGTLENCIIWGNTADTGRNWMNDVYAHTTYAYCCTTPDPGGTGNITTDPQFVASDDYHLLPSSPCIDAGTPIAGIVDDIEGTARPLDGSNDGTALPDIGAYEFIHALSDSDGDGLRDLTELNILGTSPVKINTDGDSANDYEEYVADTDALNSNVWFHITAIDGSTVWFQSSSNRIYSLLWCYDLIENNWSVERSQKDILGSGGLDSLTDPYNDPDCFYRVQVEIP